MTFIKYLKEQYDEGSLARSILDKTYKPPICPDHKCEPNTGQVQEVVCNDHYNRLPFRMLSLPYSTDAIERVNYIIERFVRSLDKNVELVFYPCCWRWRLMYGTPSTEDTLTEKQRPVFRKKNSVLQELMQVTKTYDQTASEQKSEISEPRKFSVSEIAIHLDYRYGDERLDVTFCHINRNFSSCQYLRDKLHEQLANVMDNDIILDSRIPYLSFVECISHADDRNEKHPHIIKYITNELLCREFCTFMSYCKYTS
jgi:hypothetical protein